MDKTKVQIGEDVLLDIGIHSDWYISVVGYNGESVDVVLRRKVDEEYKWWVADIPQKKVGYCNECRWFGDKQMCGRCRSKNLFAVVDTPQTEIRKDVPVICAECDHVSIHQKYLFCELSHRTVYNAKPEWCPLPKLFIVDDEPKDEHSGEAIEMVEDEPQTEKADRIPFDPLVEMDIKRMVEERLAQTEGVDNE